jgi:hypothetical protein
MQHTGTTPAWACRRDIEYNRHYLPDISTTTGYIWFILADKWRIDQTHDSP